MSNKAEEIEKQGGGWLGEVREFILRHATNGEHVTWGSEDLLHFPGLSVGDFEHLAARIAVAAISDHKPKGDSYLVVSERYQASGRLSRVRVVPKIKYYEQMGAIEGEFATAAEAVTLANILE